MSNYRGIIGWFAQLDSGLLVCGQLHPDLRVPCELVLGHSTLGASPSARTHVAYVPHLDWTAKWTMLADARWRTEQKRRGRHPAGGDPT